MSNQFYKNIIVLTAIIICVINETCKAEENTAFKTVEPNSISEKLLMLAEITKANYEKIETWQGTVNFHSILTKNGNIAKDHIRIHAGIKLNNEPNSIMTVYEGQREFKIDLKNNRIFTHMIRPNPVIYIDTDTEQTYTALVQSMQSTRIITPEYEIESSPYRRAGDGAILERRARKIIPGSRGDFTGSDPRKYFSIGKPIWELLSTLPELIEYKKQGIETYEILLEEKQTTAEKYIYRLQMIHPKSHQPTFMIVFREKAGFNPTEIKTTNENGILESHILMDFVKIEGVFLPNKRDVKQYGYSNGSLRRNDKRTIKDIKINVKIPDSVFSIHNCGLKDNDIFIDETKNKKYHYKQATKTLELIDK